MARYQVKLIVDIAADDADAAWEIAEHLEDFLGMNAATLTLGNAVEVLECEDEDEDELALEQLQGVGFA